MNSDLSILVKTGYVSIDTLSSSKNQKKLKD